jgi:uncharacterized damage-inducible protein DinB
MTDPLRPYRQLARNNHLSNRRLHRAIAALTPGEWEARRTSFFPSLRATLNHILTVDRFYIDALQGGTLGYAAFDPVEPHADPKSLADAQTALDLTLIAFVETLDPGGLARPVHIHRETRVQIDSVADTLLHLMLHDQHHRGQAHAMLSGTTVKPPQLDEFFMSDDARFRTEDLAALGWTEAEVMR